MSINNFPDEMDEKKEGHILQFPHTIYSFKEIAVLFKVAEWINEPIGIRKNNRFEWLNVIQSFIILILLK